MVPSAVPNLVRTDPTIDHYWGAGGPGGTVGSDRFVVRWSGRVKVPNGANNGGQYLFCADHDDGVKVRVGGTTIVDAWQDGSVWNPCQQGSPTVTFAPGESKDITVDYYDNTGPAFATISVQGPSGPNGETRYGQLPPSWLTPIGESAGPLPPGWTLGASQLSYAGVRLGERSAAFVDSSGAPRAYMATENGGFQPPPEDDAVVGTDVDGNLTLHASDGRSYVFDAWGNLTKAAAATDDGSHGSVSYEWTTPPGDATKPPRLTAIVDPLAGADSPERRITLRYGGRDACGDQGAFDAVPDGMLCAVDYWDGTHSFLRYRNGQLSRIEDPGDPNASSPVDRPARTDFGYLTTNDAGWLNEVRTPLAHDVFPTEASPGWQTASTKVTYDTTNPDATPRVAEVLSPQPELGERPKREYDRSVTATGEETTLVHVARGDTGLEPNGYARKVVYSRGSDGVATVKDFDATNKQGVSVYDRGDRLTSVTDPAGRRKTTVYDGDATGNQVRTHPTGRPTDAYGPAPTNCFPTDPNLPSPQRDMPNGTCTTPPVAQRNTVYDRSFGNGSTPPEDDRNGTAIEGLAVTYWDNTGLRGVPRSHGQVGGATLVASDPPPGQDGKLTARAWSARFTGELLTPGDQSFKLVLTGQARLYVDDKLVIDAWSSHPAVQTVPSGTPPVTKLAAGRHRIRVDYAPQSGVDGSLAVQWGAVAIPAANLAPRYSNAARITTMDNDAVHAGGGSEPSDRVQTTHYESQAEGLAKSETIDPGPPSASPAHLRLTSRWRYEPQEEGRYRRLLDRRLPADVNEGDNLTATAYEYYGVGQSATNLCAGGTSANQRGMVRQVISPDPGAAPASARTTVFVYDKAGRVVSADGGDGRVCTTFDPRGRIRTRTFPDGRAVTYDYSADGNPLVTRVSDSVNGARISVVTTKTDLLGRITAYTVDDPDPGPDGLAAIGARTTTYEYDRAGRVSKLNGPQGRIDTDYDAATPRVTGQYVADPGSLFRGSLVAVPSYNAAGELSSVSYPGLPGGIGNGTILSAIGRDQAGRVNDLDWKGPESAPGVRSLLAQDHVDRSQAGRVIDQKIDGVDHNGPPQQGAPNPVNFTYDAAGRLRRAWAPGHALEYEFAEASCGPLGTAGRNGNRTSVRDNGAETSYCYDRADRLVSSSGAAPVGTINYDPHGNTTALGNQVLSYDVTDRHTRTQVGGGGPTVTYVRDAADRIIARTETPQQGTPVLTRYGFGGPGDSPSFVMDKDGATIQRLIALPGGVLLTKAVGAGSADVWSYPNVHGDVMATANGAGAKQGPTRTYDPYGQGTAPDNLQGDFDYGWLGQYQRPLAGVSGLTADGAA